jgi:hypothetical protein
LFLKPNYSLVSKTKHHWHVILFLWHRLGGGGCGGGCSCGCGGLSEITDLHPFQILRDIAG